MSWYSLSSPLLHSTASPAIARFVCYSSFIILPIIKLPTVRRRPLTGSMSYDHCTALKHSDSNRELVLLTRMILFEINTRPSLISSHRVVNPQKASLASVTNSKNKQAGVQRLVDESINCNNSIDRKQHAQQDAV